MKSALIPILVIFLFGCNSTTESNDSDQPFEIPDKIRVEDFTPDSVYTSGIEGPVFDGQYLYIVNFEKQGTIGRTNTNGISEHYIDLPEGSIGNSIQIHTDGFMYVADYTGHQILKIDTASKALTTLFHNELMNQPNDFAISYDSFFYMSDPNWSDSTGNLWMFNNDQLQLVGPKMGTTNGIAMSANQNHLYVNESVQRNIWRYDINEKGIPVNKTLFKKFEDGGMDGMKCDSEGNLWVTRYGKGEVVILNPRGKILDQIKLKGFNPTNIVLIESELTIIAYVTIQERGCVEKITYPKERFKKH